MFIHFCTGRSHKIDTVPFLVLSSLVSFAELCFRSAKTEWTAERRRLKEESARLEEAEQKAKDELLRAMANSSQVSERYRATTSHITQDNAPTPWDYSPSRFPPWQRGADTTKMVGGFGKSLDDLVPMCRPVHHSEFGFGLVSAFPINSA